MKYYVRQTSEIVIPIGSTDNGIASHNVLIQSFFILKLFLPLATVHTCENIAYPQLSVHGEGEGKIGTPPNMGPGILAFTSLLPSSGKRVVRILLK